MGQSDVIAMGLTNTYGQRDTRLVCLDRSTGKEQLFICCNHADTNPENNKPWSSKSLKECYAQAGARFGWSKRNPEPRSMRNGRDLIGWGMASATYPAHRSPASARAVFACPPPARPAPVYAGTHEMGMGTATVMSQLAAETLGIPVERIRLEYGDTTLPPTPIAAGSQTTFRADGAFRRY